MAGSQPNQAARGDEPSALVVLVDGLIEHIGRSPLMRRPPAQCSPEEQHVLAGILSDLVGLRELREALEALPHLRVDLVQAHWPEVGSQLVPVRRGAQRTRAGGREAGAPSGSEQSGQAALFASTAPVDSEAPLDTEDHPTAEEDPVPVQLEESTGNLGPDLAHLLLEALTIQGRALNTTQMLAWLAERGTVATREAVTNTLYGHEELFRRRGSGHWVVAGTDARPA
jgi:hypothetical protein